MDDTENLTQASILLLDDSIVLRSILKSELRGLGFTVDSAASALDAMAALAGAGRYDLIISDFHMPGLNGAEFVEQVRRHADYRSVPILILTAGADADEKERARAAGATGWIVKPFDTQKLAAAIHKLLRRPQWNASSAYI